MRKKNKRKAPEFKKPFIVMTRRKIAGWLLLIFFLGAWMFVLGVLVGRGTAPLKFNLAAIQKKITAPQKTPPEKQSQVQSPQDEITVKDKTKLEFYEALKEDKEDTKVLIRPEAKDTEGKDAKPAEKAAAPEKSADKSKPAERPQPEAPAEDKVAAVAKTKTTGPAYTIQAAAVRNAEDADRLIAKLKKRGYPAYRSIAKVEGKGVWFRVRIGSYKSKSEARQTLDKLRKEGLKPILVLRR